MLNKVTLIGNLGSDPEIRYMPSGGAVANISLATTRRWKDKQSGERKEATEWHRVIFFNRLAEIVGEYLKKGNQIHVEGRLQTRKWQSQDGQDHYTTEIVATELIMLRTAQNDENRGSGAGSVQAKPGKAPESHSRKPDDMYPPRPQPPLPEVDDEFEDDIPF